MSEVISLTDARASRDLNPKAGPSSRDLFEDLPPEILSLIRELEARGVELAVWEDEFTLRPLPTEQLFCEIYGINFAGLD